MRATVLQEGASCTRHRRQHHIVDRAAETVLHFANRGQVHGDPVKAAMRTDRPIERRLSRAP
jgi:hypothetical protein